MKKTPKATTQTERYQYQFRPIKSYSAEDVLAAGGTTAFAHKMGKTAKTLVEKMKETPKDSFLTDQEMESALKLLREEK
ncbi:hypothetical protein [Runella sp.]|jgi:hypothetical protein|uniref:hypothetical protein n=1 Tax=Runella sp. TaxID=1960881 RepID=UPI0026233994|nr:hypothetical protein [Runella sp.]